MRRFSPSRQAAACLGVLALTFSVPLLWRVGFAAWGPAPASDQPSYLPSLEATRPRGAFDAGPIQGLRDMQPGVVIIGDSMAGRVEEHHLTAISGKPVAPILMNATGPAYWYLVFKNNLVASGVRPDWVLVFFRDTNLTDLTFRLDGPYRDGLDLVALDREPELDQVIARRISGPWWTVHRGVDAIYRTRAVRAWIEPAIAGWPARWLGGARNAPLVIDRVNAAFTLDKLRVMTTADIDSVDRVALDFDRNVESSVLPLWLSLAREKGLRVMFIRVLRRTRDGRPPDESPELTAYVGRLRAYIESNGALMLDDRDDPSLSALAYADGDHIARDARVPYTDRLWSKLRQMAR